MDYLSTLNIEVCPYMPDGFILLSDREKWVVVKVADGSIIEIQKFPAFQPPEYKPNWGV